MSAFAALLPGAGGLSVAEKNSAPRSSIEEAIANRIIENKARALITTIGAQVRAVDSMRTKLNDVVTSLPETALSELGKLTDRLLDVREQCEQLHNTVAFFVNSNFVNRPATQKVSNELLRDTLNKFSGTNAGYAKEIVVIGATANNFYDKYESARRSPKN
ncbi:MAG TPA: hypothetical protein VI957_03340 [Candidatus Paceibacterota bacterium]